MTFYNNHVITIITTSVDIVTVDHCIDHCDYFPCRELYVLVSDFIIRMKPKPFPRARSDSFLEALPHCLTIRSQGERAGTRDFWETKLQGLLPHPQHII